MSLLIAGAPACSVFDEAPRPVSLLVTNATCNPGPCTAIRVLAFPDDQPRTPGGLWSLDLGTAQHAIATNWYAAFVRYVLGDTAR